MIGPGKSEQELIDARDRAVACMAARASHWLKSCAATFRLKFCLLTLKIPLSSQMPSKSSRQNVGGRVENSEDDGKYGTSTVQLRLHGPWRVCCSNTQFSETKAHGVLLEVKQGGKYRPCTGTTGLDAWHQTEHVLLSNLLPVFCYAA